MSDLSALQTLVSWANVGVIISLALSFVFGAASILLANKLGKLKDTQAETAQRNLELAVATQQERAAKAEKALIEVQERIKPRRPTREQIDALAIYLHNNPIKGKVDMLFQQGDPEAYNFALELLQVLRENDWGPFDSMNPEPTPNAYGEIRMYCPDRSAPECQVLSEGLRGVGLPVSGGHDPKLPSGKILIIIGTELRQPIREKSN